MPQVKPQEMASSRFPLRAQASLAMSSLGSACLLEGGGVSSPTRRPTNRLLITELISPLDKTTLSVGSPVGEDVLCSTGVEQETQRLSPINVYLSALVWFAPHQISPIILLHTYSHMYFVLTSKIWEDGLLSAKGSGIARFRDNIETTRPLALGSLTLDLKKKKCLTKWVTVWFS